MSVTNEGISTQLSNFPGLESNTGSGDPFSSSGGSSGGSGPGGSGGGGTSVTFPVYLTLNPGGTATFASGRNKIQLLGIGDSFVKRAYLTSKGSMGIDPCSGAAIMNGVSLADNSVSSLERCAYSGTLSFSTGRHDVGVCDIESGEVKVAVVEQGGDIVTACNNFGSGGSGGSGGGSGTVPGGSGSISVGVPAIGGGPEYVSELSQQRLITQSDATCTASTADKLMSCLESASSGDVVWVPGNVEMNVDGYDPFPIKAGVTLASSRGQGGSQGGLIYRDEVTNYDPIFSFTGDNARMTGLRVRGRRDYPSDPDEALDYFDRPDEDPLGIQGEAVQNVEMDNNEIYNFASRCVRFQDGSGGEEILKIHHNNIHHCFVDGVGYGVKISSSTASIKYNQFDYYRHAVAATPPDAQYDIQCNIVGPHYINDAIDMHPGPDEPNDGSGGISGDWIKINRNLFLGPYYDGGQSHIHLESAPREVSPIKNNWFEQSDDEAVRQNYEVGDWENLDVSGNNYEIEPSSAQSEFQQACSN